MQGLSVIARQTIAPGQFVAQYAGEMLTNSEADNRLAAYDINKAEVGHALLVPPPLLLILSAFFGLSPRPAL